MGCGGDGVWEALERCRKGGRYFRLNVSGLVNREKRTYK